MLLYIIRHGDPNYELDCLTPKGRRQAEAVGRRLAQSGLDEIYTSSMGRAVETATPACELTGLTPHIVDWSREVWPQFALTLADGRLEFPYGCLDGGFLRGEYMERFGRQWYEAKEFSTIDGKAAYQKVQDDSDAFFASLGYVREGARYRIERPNEKRVAMFCHEGFSLVWLSILLNLPLPQVWGNFLISHTGVTIFHFRNDADGYTTPRCLCLSDTSHIYAEHLPMLQNNRLPI